MSLFDCVEHTCLEICKVSLGFGLKRRMDDEIDVNEV